MTETPNDPQTTSDQDAEPTMNAPAEGRPDDADAELHAEDGPDQVGSENDQEQERP